MSNGANVLRGAGRLALLCTAARATREIAVPLLHGFDGNVRCGRVIGNACVVIGEELRDDPDDMPRPKPIQVLDLMIVEVRGERRARESGSGDAVMGPRRSAPLLGFTSFRRSDWRI